MRGVFRISEAVSLGMHAAVYLASREEGVFSTPSIARTLNVSEAHLTKVMQHLSRARLVRAIRGPRGGFRLARKASKITLLDIFQALEGTYDFPTCLLGVRKCRTGRCIFGNLTTKINKMVYQRFSRTTLSHVKNAFQSTRRPKRSSRKRRKRR